jgi:hypothetical protein
MFWYDDGEGALLLELSELVAEYESNLRYDITKQDKYLLSSQMRACLESQLVILRLRALLLQNNGEEGEK